MMTDRRKELRHSLAATVLGLVLVSLMASIPGAQSAAVMSVDLGSEWMKVGVVSAGVPMEIALNKESKRKTASVVAFRDGERQFGEDAQNIGVRFPHNSYGYLTDLLGKTVDNPIVDLYKKRFPYYTIEGDATRNTVVFVNGDTRFSVEELIAQLLQKAREFAEETAGQPIAECVITVPGYFGQAERLALLASAQLANLKVLQLINDYTAVALNYGVFQRKEINETASYYVFYDMGAYKTCASVIGYQLVRDKQTKEMVPVITVLGVALDRTLGGLEMQLRLRDHLARQFNAMKKTKTDVFTNPRALAKLFKEAGRLKTVLSANADHYAQIEGLLEEHDFKLLVTREEFEEMCKDLFERVPKVLENALKASGLSLDIIQQVVWFGGNTRVPKVQEYLKEAIGRDLAKNLNSDEAATMGAAYKAADLGTGFKVKRYITKDAVLLPIQVTFEKEDAKDGRLVRRTLFGSMNPYPQKKVITFNKHSHDFTFYVNYAVQDVLSEKDIAYLGSLNLTRVDLKGVREALERNSGERIESKGIKAHFALDESGVFSLAQVELVVEKTVTDEDEEDEDKNTFSILGSTISKLFSGDSKAKAEDEKKAADKEQQQDEEKKAQEGEELNMNVNATQGNDTESVAAKNKTAEPRVKVIKEQIANEVTKLFIEPLDGDSFEASRKKIDVLDVEERNRNRRENLLNELESFVVDTVQKLDQKEYKRCASGEEVEKVRAECAKLSDWLYDEGADADADTYEKKLKDLKKMTNDIYSRHWEHQERPEAVKSLNTLVDKARTFWKTSKNFTKDTNPQMDVFTVVEIETLEKLIVKTEEWRDKEAKEQALLKPHEPVRLTVRALVDKMEAIDRELKYMANKMKIWKPKIPKKPENDTKEANADEEKPVHEEDQENVPPTEDQEEAPVVEEPEEVEVKDDDESTPHGEL